MNKSIPTILFFIASIFIYPSAQIPFTRLIPKPLPTETLAYPYPVSTPTPILFTPSPNQTSEIEVTNARLQALEQQLDVQAQLFEATVARMESNTNLLLAIMAIASVLLAVMGFGVVRFWISNTVEGQLRKALSEQMQSLAEREISRLRSEWESKFLALYEEYKGIRPKD